MVFHTGLPYSLVSKKEVGGDVKVLEMSSGAQELAMHAYIHICSHLVCLLI